MENESKHPVLPGCDGDIDSEDDKVDDFACYF